MATLEADGKDDYYPMCDPKDPKRKRGRCVILNYKKFASKRERNGTEFDEAELKKTFSKLNFEVLVHNDLTKAGTELVLKEIESQIDHSEYFCFVLCILSHGKKNEFECVDDQQYQFEDIYKQFDEVQSLRGKPKLYFIQACQGSEINEGHDEPRLQPDSCDEVDYVEVTSSSSQSVGKMLDILSFICCYSDHLSMRNPSQGSWFIQDLCKILNENAHKEDIHQMFRMVTAQVAQREAEQRTKTQPMIKKRVKQTPVKFDTLRKNIKFF